MEGGNAGRQADKVALGQGQRGERAARICHRSLGCCLLRMMMTAPVLLLPSLRDVRRQSPKT